MPATQSQKWAQMAHRHMTKTDRVGIKEKKEKYGGLWMRLPFLVMTNGLSQAVAFVASKVKDDRPECTWVLSDIAEILGYGANTVQTQVQAIQTTQEYALATRKVLDASIWYKRYAEGIYGLDPASDAARGDR